MFARISVLLLACTVMACGGESDAAKGKKEVFPVTVDIDSNPIQFSWSGSPVHALTVWACGSACVEATCVDGEFDVGSSGLLSSWSVQPLSTAPPPRIASPVAYAAVIDGTQGGVAKPLIGGDAYAIELLRYSACPDEPTECWITSAAGCAVFTAP